MRLPLLLLRPTLALLSLALLVLPAPPGVHAHPPSFPPLALLPPPTLEELPDWEAAALLQLQASLDLLGLPPPPWGPTAPRLLDLGGPGDPRLQLLREEDGWGAVRRGPRGDLLERTPLGAFPGPPLTDTLYGDGGEGEGGGGKRNEALNSIAGGLQAFNREKGGFGFRFGRK